VQGVGLRSSKVALAQSTNQVFDAINNIGSASGQVVDHRTVKKALSSLHFGTIRYRQNHVIACEGEAADYIFVVARGVVRTCKNFERGGRSVVAFYLPGDIVGWSEQNHSLSVEAASDAVVRFVKRSALTSLAVRDSGVSGLLLGIATSQLRRAQEHAVRMSMRTKPRVASFLIDLGRRSGTANSVKLLMSHQDIADHLGLRRETLSRRITQLQRVGIVSRSGTRTLIVDYERLLRQVNP